MRRERGVALVTALLVVALATTAAVAMVSRQQVDIRRTGNLLDGEQAFLYQQGLEDWAARILRQDREDSETDHLQEDWATILPPIDIEGGQLAGRLEDLQGRFNLNNLVRNGQRSAPDLLLFQRLLAHLSLDPALAEAVVDWVDADVDPTAFGAEDGAYLDRSPAYRTANRPMADASELRLVAGVDRDAWQALAPFVTALPARTAVNVNTAPAPLLMALADGLTEADADALIAVRGEDGFASAQEFLQQNVFAGRDVEADAVAVASHYFRVDSRIRVGRITLQMRSTLWRDADGTTRLLQRAQERY